MNGRVLDENVLCTANTFRALRESEMRASEIVTTDVGLVASAGLVLPLAHNVCTRALRKTAPDVLVIAQIRLRKDPDGP